MDLSEPILGARIANYIRERATAPLLRIGKDTFDRSVLANVSCFNFLAAGNLSTILADLGVKDTRDLFDRIHPRELALPRLGGVSLAVLGAAFEAKGVGGDAPLLAWYTRHLKGNSESDNIVSFQSLKRHDQRAAARDNAARAKRKHARRAKAHRLRTARFEARL
jgi:hypothetical protein